MCFCGSFVAFVALVLHRTQLIVVYCLLSITDITFRLIKRVLFHYRWRRRNGSYMLVHEANILASMDGQGVRFSPVLLPLITHYSPGR